MREGERWRGNERKRERENWNSISKTEILKDSSG